MMSVHGLLKNIIRLLGRIWIFIVLMYLVGVIFMIGEIKLSHQSDTESWSHLLKDKLNLLSVSAKIGLADNKRQSSNYFYLDINGVIIESNSAILKGFSLQNSSLFKKISELKEGEEYILLDSGLLENRLKAYFIRKDIGGYAIINYPPEEFIPPTLSNTIVLFYDKYGKVLYSTHNDYIGSQMKPRVVIFKNGKVFLSSRILVDHSDIQSIFMLRDISTHFYILIIIGLVFTLSIFLFNIYIKNIKNGLKKLQEESEEINSIVTDLSIINDEQLPESLDPFDSYREILIKLKKRIESKDLIFQENIETKKIYRLLIDRVIELLNRIDITTQKQKLIENESTRIRIERDRVEVMTKAKSDFFANISHELRTPLNAVVGFSELLSSTITDQKDKSYVQAIQTSSKSLLHLINNILDLSKIESGKMKITLTVIDLETLINEVTHLFLFATQNKSVEIIVDIDENTPTFIESDETKLRQILINIIGNAIKFTDEGLIKIKTHFNGADLIIEVKDSGRGISDRSISHIFNEFHQEGDQSGITGSGLGLPICKRLTELLGGEIEVISDIGVGSSFIVKLKKISIKNRLTKPDKEKIGFINYHFNSSTVLIIDDEEFNRTIVKEALTIVGLNVLESKGGIDGFNFAMEIKPDLILLDIRMPNSDGWKTIKLIRECNTLKFTPVIAFTASLNLGNIDVMKDCGFNDVIFKPTKISNLLKKIGYFIPYNIADNTNINADSYILQLNKDDYIKVKKLLPVTNKSGTIIKVKEMKKLAKILKDIPECHNFSSKFDLSIESYDIETMQELLTKYHFVEAINSV
ncbi:MAG: ATP-binding protein [Spirochaetaceae bacterium]